jgi:hypothetical protein
MPSMLQKIAKLTDAQLKETSDALEGVTADDLLFVREAVAMERERRQDSRAFCPGASPPDNSCSPASKGTGGKGATGKKQGAKKTGDQKKKSAIESQMDAIQKYQQTFDGSSLARPMAIMGMPDFHVDPVKFSGYLESKGQEWRAAPLPPDIPPGVPQECYSNATQLVLRNKNLDYAEGIAYPSGMSGLGFLHGWAVDRNTGQVVDNTWNNPERAKYFGVRYDRQKYMRHVARTKYYGVVGGDSKAAAKVIERGEL